LTPPVVGADLRAAYNTGPNINAMRYSLNHKIKSRRTVIEIFQRTLVASCFLGAFPPVDLRAVCFVRAIYAHKAKQKFRKENNWTFLAIAKG